jgi:predicted Rossmann fold flavoprotein
MAKVVVIGAGAGGMLAAGRAAECGAKVVLLERNSLMGRKLRLAGKGRGNVTNTADPQEFIAAFGPNGKFLYGAFSRFSNQDLIDLLHRLGVPTKVERGGRVFPASDRAADVVAALEAWIRGLGVEVRTGVRVQLLVTGRAEPQPSAISHQPLAISGVRVFSGVIPADAVVLATGGITYPRTGSTGDGYRMAEEVGHTVVSPVPSLSALETKEPWVPQLQGLSLRNVTAALFAGGKRIGGEFGEMLFTHFGVSGPIILTLSKAYVQLRKEPGSSRLQVSSSRLPTSDDLKPESCNLEPAVTYCAGDAQLSINLKPALTREQLDERLIRDFTQPQYFKNYLPELLPRTLIPVFMHLSGVPENTPLNAITKTQRKRIIDLLVDFRLTITGARAADEAIVTAGGVSIKEIDPRTMESKLVAGLYFAGEVVDIDAITGGFNLQAAFSTGWVAGESATTHPP